jgi:hypothetical protein
VSGRIFNVYVDFPRARVRSTLGANDDFCSVFTPEALNHVLAYEPIQSLNRLALKWARTDQSFPRTDFYGISFGVFHFRFADPMLWNMASGQIGRQAHNLKVTGSNAIPATKF